jgi:hypothetical protein
MAQFVRILLAYCDEFFATIEAPGVLPFLFSADDEPEGRE